MLLRILARHESVRKFQVFCQTNEQIHEITHYLSSFNRIRGSNVAEHLFGCQQLVNQLQRELVSLKNIHPLKTKSHLSKRITQYIPITKLCAITSPNFLANLTREIRLFWTNFGLLTDCLLTLTSKARPGDRQDLCIALILVQQAFKWILMLESGAPNHISLEGYLKLNDQIRSLLSSLHSELSLPLWTAYQTENQDSHDRICLLLLEFAFSTKSFSVPAIWKLAAMNLKTTLVENNADRMVKQIRMIHGLELVNTHFYAPQQIKIQQALSCVIDEIDSSPAHLTAQLDRLTLILVKSDACLSDPSHQRLYLQLQDLAKRLFTAHLSQIDWQGFMPFFKNVFLRGFEGQVPLCLGLFDHFEALLEVSQNSYKLSELSAFLQIRLLAGLIKGTLNNSELTLLLTLIRKFNFFSKELTTRRSLALEELYYTFFVSHRFLLAQPLNQLGKEGLMLLEAITIKLALNQRDFAERFSEIFTKTSSFLAAHAEQLGYIAEGRTALSAFEVSIKYLELNHERYSKSHFITIFRYSLAAGVTEPFLFKLETLICNKMMNFGQNFINMMDLVEFFWLNINRNYREVQWGSNLRRLFYQLLLLLEEGGVYQFFTVKEHATVLAPDFQLRTLFYTMRRLQFLTISNREGQNQSAEHTKLIQAFARAFVDLRRFIHYRRLNIRDNDNIQVSAYKLTTLPLLLLTTLEFFSINKQNLECKKHFADISEDFYFCLNSLIEMQDYERLQVIYSTVASSPFNAIEDRVLFDLDRALINLIEFNTRQLTVFSREICASVLIELIDFLHAVLPFVKNPERFFPSLKALMSQTLTSASNLLDFSAYEKFFYLYFQLGEELAQDILPFLLEVIKKYPIENLKYADETDRFLAMKKIDDRLFETISLFTNSPIFSTLHPGQKAVIHSFKQTLTSNYLGRKDFIFFDTKKRQFQLSSELWFLLLNQAAALGFDIRQNVKFFSRIYDFYFPTKETFILLTDSLQEGFNPEQFRGEHQLCKAYGKHLIILDEGQLTISGENKRVWINKLLTNL